MCSSLHKTDTLCNATSQTGEGTHEESGAADVALEGSSAIGPRQNRRLDWRGSPYTQDQLGSINGFGVDQLMDIVFHCCDSVCTDNPTHTSAFAPLWCNADVYTHVLICIFFLWEEDSVINAVLSNNIKLQTKIYIKSKKKPNSSTCVYCDIT